MGQQAGRQISAGGKSATQGVLGGLVGRDDAASEQASGPPIRPP
ncbi:hypothetical protein [Deinococcus sp.]